jgi:hypothetical protein
MEAPWLIRPGPRCRRHHEMRRLLDSLSDKVYASINRIDAVVDVGMDDLYDPDLVGPTQVPYALVHPAIEEMRVSVPLQFDAHRALFQALRPTPDYQAFVLALSANAEATILNGLVRLRVVLGDPILELDGTYETRIRSIYHHEMIKLGLKFFLTDITSAFNRYYYSSVHDQCYPRCVNYTTVSFNLVTTKTLCVITLPLPFIFMYHF